MGKREITETLTLPSLPFPVLLTRKNIKNMYLRVMAPEGEVRMSAPLRAEPGEILNFLRRQEPWIKNKRRQILVARGTPIRYETGDIVSLWGKKYPLERVTRQVGGTACNAGVIYLFAPTDSTSAERESFLQDFYRRELTAKIADLRFSCETRVGKLAREYRVRDMKTRWGTCNIKTARIWLNLNLAKYPPAALEYVMIHELTHLWERGHNERFWQLVGNAFPAWREIRQMLKSEP